jgi:hypothetical protein
MTSAPDGARAELAAAILRAGHRCIECGEPLGAPCWDEGEWIPNSRHGLLCPVLAGGQAMQLEYRDIVDALHRAGYGADYGEPVPVFSAAVAR